MATEFMSDKLSIKNLLFSKAIPNYVIPEPVDGHKVFGCTDCGDRFILESSYEYHINRKSVQITYMCRPCGMLLIFHNRCNLMSHIRSHVFKTATINVFDLKVSPLPISYYNKVALNTANETLAQQTTSTTTQVVQSSIPAQVPSPSASKKKNACVCFECKMDISSSKSMYKNRAKHYMKYTLDIYTCPICLFALPTVCGFKAHVRLHLKLPPFYCPECGVHLPNKSLNYPYNHFCDGFNMMRATSRVKCFIPECNLLHPNELKDHMKEKHLKRVFKCSNCLVACFNQSTMEKHLGTHEEDAKVFLFFQCELCPGRLVLQTQIDNHLKGHVMNTHYPCWTCGIDFNTSGKLIEHHVDEHTKDKELLLEALQEYSKTLNLGLYRVIKKCGQCQKSFTYKCSYNQISILPNECPNKCSNNGNDSSDESSGMIVCFMCKNKISEDWDSIKEHYATYHKSYKCLDAKIKISRLKLNKSNFKSKNKMTQRNKIMNTKAQPNLETDTIIGVPNNSNQEVCVNCGLVCKDKDELVTHLITHRDPCMAYQCMECGLCFVVKGSFSTHLLLVHGIYDVEEYIRNNKCYNEHALNKQLPAEAEKPLLENQCNICRDQFDSIDDLEKHFRSHGMAFLMKNTSSKSNSNSP